MNTDAIQLTADQQRAAELLLRFVEGDQGIYILRGYAGTGKTFILNFVVSHLEQVGIPYRLMAPTGRAAKVLSQRTNRPAATIHRSIYQFEDVKESRSESDAETYKFYFDLAHNRDDARCVYLVDEASMISNQYTEGEFFRFGSGHLLDDLLAYTGKVSGGTARKIIFCGDPAQLPPVNENVSKALMQDEMQALTGQSVPECELKEVIRQQDGSGILQTATWLRERISASEFNSFRIDPAYDIDFLTETELLDKVVDLFSRQGHDQVILIAATNAKVKLYNQMIRERLFGEDRPIQPGDRIIIARNNYKGNIPLVNGEFGTVVSASGSTEKFTIPINQPINGKRNIVHVPLEFRRLDLSFTQPDGTIQTTSCLINETLLNSTEALPATLYSKAMYVHFRSRHKALDSRSPAFKKALVDDPYFNCLQIKYGYAITCHKAQGGEWPHVFIDMQPAGSPSHADYFRWAYTAITRCRKALGLVNAPCFSVLKAKKSVQVPADIQTIISARKLSLPASPEGDKAPAITFPDEPAFLAPLYQAIKLFLENYKVRITDVRHRPYAEFYMLKLPAAQSSVLTLNYRASNKITRLSLHPGDSPLLHEITLALEVEFLGKQMLAPPDAPLAPPPATSSQQEVDAPKATPATDAFTTFEQTLRDSLKSNGIFVRSAERITAYHLACKLANETGHCHINYYFNGNGQLTNVLPDLHQSTSESLVRTVMGLSR